jgi:hypothetical protein
MAYTDTSSSFTSLAMRQDSDGKGWFKATALEALTAGTPYLLFVGATAWEAQAVFDTGYAVAGSVTYGVHWAYVGVPANAIASDGSGWLQVQGYNASVTLGDTTITAGSAIKWDTATMSSSGSTYTGAQGQWAVGAISDSSGSNTAFAINQIAVRVAGTS